MTAWAQKQKGFTIVELLIVVVVIAILAAITILAYNGIQQRARASALQTTVTDVAKRIEAEKAGSASEQYPSSLASLNISSADVNYYYSPDDNSYCITKTDGSMRYSATSNNPAAVEGDCGINGIVGWYKMNNNGVDDGPSGANASLTSVISVTGQNGQANGAYSFNGTDSQLYAPSYFGLTNTNATLSTWVYTFSSSDYGAFIRVGTASGSGSDAAGYGIGMGDSTMSNAGTRLGAIFEGRRWIMSTTNIPLNTWNHVALTIDGSGVPTLYLNGTRVGVYPGSTALNPTVQGTAIGGYQTSRFFGGRLDDARFYNRALTDAEIAGMYAAGAQ
jgi:prepilin-type N-terminal cleavage/methylation domain-containing protein